MSRNRRVIIFSGRSDHDDVAERISAALGGSDSGRPSLAKRLWTAVFGGSAEPAAPFDEPDYDISTCSSVDEALTTIQSRLGEDSPIHLFCSVDSDRSFDAWVEDLNRFWEADANLRALVFAPLGDLETSFQRLRRRSNALVFERIPGDAELAQLVVFMSELYEADLKLTQLAETDEKLVSAKNYISDVLRTLPAMVMAVDGEGRVAEWNKAAETHTGVAADKALGEAFWDVVPFLRAYKENFEKVIESGVTKELSKVGVLVGDEERHMDIVMWPLTYDGNKGAVIQVEDVTEAVKKDEHLRQAQKMDTVGNLAAGLAHDFNNVIGGIQATATSIEFSLEMTDSLESLKKDLGNDLAVIKEAAENGADMVEQLLSISRRKELDFSPVNLNEAVKKVVNICRHTFDKSIEFNVTYFDGDATLRGYPTQLEQVLLNLCVNASHAMTIMRGEGERQGGALTIAVDKIQIGENMASTFPEAQVGDYWMVTLSDTGVGMSKETMSKIYDPFFTTKEKGKGSGLGLSMVFNIIRQHKGFLEVYSEVGEGATFLVFLPVFDPDSEPESQNEQTTGEDDK